ncbi:hypothetical protein J4407_00320 [Candidatus Pacearchaeota archaeon]|uniref:R15P Isomerase n=1 Tax=uncultured Candidatus Pacearchaeota archaeon TaxID=2109283 RepID=A0A447IU80_9ARCH|nr:hypothetical protein [Candidatus Pacearchaeota archaeon]VDS11065.1 R15P Isomerase [uncultured Candidatus Pacearchaeota archaeon]VDS11080.1 R15P Isomerase [uncultured Candidatus Pacearchaeota archaeon]
MMNHKEKKFNKIVKDIKSVKIQGARNIAEAAIKAYFLVPSKKAKKILFNSRPTEPMMQNVLDMTGTYTEKEILNHFDSTQEKINKFVLKLIRKNSVVFTHCHSTNVSNALIYAHKKRKKFEVYLTETRPLYQGRKTARELRNAGIKSTMFVDSAIGVALSGEQGAKKVNAVFIGADALLKSGVINKVGSEIVARVAMDEKIPFYVVADSWKFTKEKILIEQRSLNEIWDKAPKNVKIKNPAFEFVPKKYIKAIISEYGVLSYNSFLKKVS